MRTDSDKKYLLIPGTFFLFFLFLIAPGHAGKAKKAIFQGRNIAHRGLFSPDQSVPENSLEAFRLAVESGYGIELDVQLSRDGQVVVFHDDTLERVCGRKARVDELDYEELKDLPLCGSEQRMPLFSEVLALVDGREPMIVELKNGRRNRELCEKTLALLTSYAGDYCIESFHPLIVAWFRFHAPKILRGQLAQQKELYLESGMNGAEARILAGTLLNFAARPQFIAYCVGQKPLSVRIAQALGAMRVCWTSHDAANEAGNDTVIFEHYRPRVRFRKD